VTAAPRHSFPDRTTLTHRDRIVLRAVAEAMFSQDGEVERARLDAHVDEVDAFISAASKPLRVGLRIALFIVSIAPLLLFFRMRRIDKLSVDDRVVVLSRLERSRITNLSLAFIGWRTVMTLVFYENPVELQRLGYAGDERKVYKRRLTVVTTTPVQEPIAVEESLMIPLVAVAPPPDESGVRLRDNTSERADAESVQNKVA
jgi:hypothetical protein